MLNKLYKLINQSEKTLIIAPAKYHKKIIENLQKESPIILNLQLLTIDNLLNNLLGENLISYDDDSSIVEKIKINQHLIEINHEYKNNINYVNELFKVKKEFYLSNINTPDNFELPITYEALPINKITSDIKHLILLSDEDIFPLHSQLLEQLKNHDTRITNFYEYNQTETKQYRIEHKNTINMLDYVLAKTLEINDLENTLIICDSDMQKDYFKSQLIKLGLSYDEETANTHPKVYKLRSIFNVLDHNCSRDDINKVVRLLENSSITITDLENAHSVDYHAYLKMLYTLLIETSLFVVSDLNNLFSDLYKIKATTDKLLLNQLLLTTLSNKLVQVKVGVSNALMLASSSFNSLPFKHVMVVDSSLASFKQSKPSYLLDTTKREQISKALISVIEYGKQYRLAQQRLLTCGKHIYFNNALVDLANKSSAPAFFIKQQKDNQENLANDYYHIFTRQPVLDSSSLLVSQPIAKEKIMNKLNHKINISPSALDTFGKCPYKYFVDYILRPQEAISFDNRDLGSIYHKIIEQISNDLITNNQTFSSLDMDSIEKEIETKINEQINQTLNDKEYLDLANYQATKLKMVMLKTLVKNIEFFRYFETLSKYRLQSTELPLKMQYQQDNVFIKGFVDAVFNYQDKAFVLDYKSGARAFNKKEFNHGVSNQLITYTYLLKKATTINNNIQGAFYKTLKDNYVDSNQLINHEENIEKHQKDNELTGLYVDENLSELNIAFDATFESEGHSLISDITLGKKSKNAIDRIELENMHRTLEWHIDKMLSTIDSGIFAIDPYEKTACEYCSNQNICHNPINSVKGRKEQANLDYEEFAANNHLNGGNSDEQ